MGLSSSFIIIIYLSSTSGVLAVTEHKNYTQ